MNENPEGTPNPLNPTPGATEAEAMGTGTTLEYEETAVQIEDPEAPSAAETPSTVETSSTPEANGGADIATEANVMNDAAENQTPSEVNVSAEASDAAEANAATETSTASTPRTLEITEITESDETPAEASIPETFSTSDAVKPASFTEAATISSSMPEMKQADKPPVKPSRNTVDPMMRPKNNNFDTLEMDEEVLEEWRKDEVVPGTPATPDEGSGLVAKNSIVQPAGKSGKKKALIACAIVLLMTAIICGAAAIAIMVMNNNGGDRVTKAIEKLLDGGTSNIIAVQGDINTVADSNAGASITTTNVNFNGTFDTASGMNTVSADVNAEVSGGGQISIGLNELRNKSGDVYFKVSGLDSILNPAVDTSDTSEVVLNAEALTATNCIDDTANTNCASSLTASESEAASVLGLVSFYSGLLEVVNDQWILVSDDFAESMKEMQLFDNTSTCLISALGTLPKYSNDIVSKYNANQFVTYSTDNLAIAKKKNPLYKLGIDSGKMTAFVNSLSNNGFINELNACAGNAATNEDVATGWIKDILDKFPTVYVEVNDNYDFTRVYFRTNAEMNDAPATVTADLALSYPAKLEVVEPEEYVDMSTLLNTALTDIFSGGNS